MSNYDDFALFAATPLLLLTAGGLISAFLNAVTPFTEVASFECPEGYTISFEEQDVPLIGHTEARLNAFGETINLDQWREADSYDPRRGHDPDVLTTKACNRMYGEKFETISQHIDVPRF